MLEEEYALLAMMSAQPREVNDILTTNRGSRSGFFTVFQSRVS
jgi:hypothetical protein